MHKDYLTEFLPDLGAFHEKTMQFHNKELTVAQYKGISGGFGSYAQRGGARHMLRLRMAGGRLTTERLRFIVEIAEKYHIDLIKLTTCQSIQLHNLEAENLCDIMKAAWQAGMMTRGGGGDFPRNVMASPLSGVQRDEYFDVLPYAEAAGEYMMGFIKAVKFPRKLKVCFQSSPANETHATFRDLGFVANDDGTFDVYAAGGLGNNPMLGLCVAEHIAPETILYYVKAMVDTFVTYGNFENRGRARTRYLQETLGTDGLIQAYREKLQAAQEAEQLDITVTPAPVTKSGSLCDVLNPRLIPQKQDGLFAVFYQPVGGVLAPKKAAELCALIQDMEDVEIRLTPKEGLYLINLNGDEAKRALAATADSAKTLFETSVACIGSAICQAGVGDSQALLSACVKAVQAENFPDGTLPKIHISGCPSSCGTHQIAAIGFRGAVKQTPDGPKPAFAISLDGCPLQGQEALAPTGKAITVEEIPRFLVELGHRVLDAGMAYADWVSGHRKELDALVAKYTA